MKRPPNQTLILGHPVVATPLVLTTIFIGFFAAGADNAFAVVVAFLGIGWLANCCREAAAYRTWQREWNALDPDYRPPQHLKVAGRSLVLLATVGLGLWLCTTFNDPDSPALAVAVLLLIGLIAIGAVRIMRRGLARRVTTPSEFVVAQAINRPVSAPPVADAYAGLPEYARPIISSEPARKERP